MEETNNSNNIQLLKQIILGFLQNSDLKNCIKYKETEVVYPGSVENVIKLEGRVTKNKQMALEEFRETLYDLLADGIGNEAATEFINNSFNVEVGISELEKFESLDAFDENANKVKISHQSGQVLMIDFWATWCGYCQEPMQENVDLMVKKPHLKEKNITILGLSCDENQNKWKEHIQAKNWTAIPQYVKGDILKLVGIRGIPCVVIVNKSGVIAYVGHPSGINLEVSLLNLAEDKPIKKSVDSQDNNQSWNILDQQSKTLVVAESNFAIKDAGVVNANFCIATKYDLDVETNEVIPVKVTPTFYGEVTQFEFDTLQTVAITLQTNYNLNGFAFNVRVIQIGADEDF